MPFRIVTTYNECNPKPVYFVAATPLMPPSWTKETVAMIGTSPDSADQWLFLSIIRSLSVAPVVNEQVLPK